MTKVIGITGGIGAGKSAILTYLEQQYECTVIQADLVAHDVKEPQGICYAPLVELLGKSVCDENGLIRRDKMAQMIFANEDLLRSVNNIIHPAVKEVILDRIASCKKKFIFIEAALLIEDGYLPYLDELWYIYAEEEVRYKRLRENRGYSEEKINQIFEVQLQEECYRAECDFMIDNSKTLVEAYRQIEEHLA